MANDTLTANPVILSNGSEFTISTSGGNLTGALVVDSSKFTCTKTEKGFDNTGAATTTTLVPFSVIAATESGGVITCKLSLRPVWKNDTTVSIAIAAGAFTDGANSNNALTATAATNNSSLEYAGAPAHFPNPPHERHVGAYSHRVDCTHPWGIACVKHGITKETSITTDGSGIATASLGAEEYIRFNTSGAIALIAPGSDLTTGAGAKTIKCFVHSGTPTTSDAGIKCATIITTTSAGITKRFIPGENVTCTGSGASGFIYAGDIQGPGQARRLILFITSGTAAAADVVTGATSGASATVETAGATVNTSTFAVASLTVGGTVSATSTEFAARICGSNNYGPANGPNAYIDEWRQSLTPTSRGQWERWYQVFPSVGDIPIESRRLGIGPVSTAIGGDTVRGDNQIWCDPDNDEAALLATLVYYVDETNQNSIDGSGITGTFTAFEPCLVTAAGVLVNAFYAIGDNSAGTQTGGGATDLRWVPLQAGVVLCTMAVTGLTGGTPAFGNIITKSGNFLGASSYIGKVLKWVDAGGGTGTITYLLYHGTNFGAEACILRDADGLTLGISFTSAGGAATSLTTVASTHVVTGASSGASCTLDGAIVANGSDSNAGTSSGAPLLTGMKAMKLAATARNAYGGVGGGLSIADGVTIYYKRGTMHMVYAAGNEAETRYYGIYHLPAPGIELVNCRVVRYNTASSNGHLTNFQSWTGFRIWNTSSQSGIYVLANGSNVTGSYDRPAYILRDNQVWGEFRWQRGAIAQWVTSSALFHIHWENCSVQYSQITGRNFIDCQYSKFGDDLYTQGRLVVNCRHYDIQANGSDYHCDVWQGQGTENGNLLIHGIKGTGLGNVQNAPFMNASANGSWVGMTIANCHQAQDYGSDGVTPGTNLSQVGVAGGTNVTYTMTDVFFLNNTQEDNFAWRANAATRVLQMLNLRVACSVWASHDVTETGAANILGVYTTQFFNNHYVTDPSTDVTPVGGNPRANAPTDTITTTLANCFVSMTESDAAFMVPKAASVLLNRDTARPNGWYKYDVYGRPLSTDATAKAAIGAAQPIPVLTVTYDGDAMTDGGTISEDAGSRSLAFGNSGPTGSVARISDVAFSGTVAGTDTSPLLVVSGGTAVSPITTTLTAGSAGIDISWDLSSVFDFDITAEEDSSPGYYQSRIRVNRLNGLKRAGWRLIAPVVASILFASVFFTEIDTASRNLT